jgi:chemotaxis protein methyltransferase CheR
MTPPPSAAALLVDPAYPRLRAFVIRATGLAYYDDKDDDLAGRLGRRLGPAGVGDCAAYLALLGDPARGPEELDALITELTIGETFFFRHRELFDALRDVVLPERIAANQASRQLRVWSAGCATGAEPYSVAIVLRRDLGPRVAGWELTVLGTDINREFLARAREGLYEEWALRATPDAVRRDCFAREGAGWRLAPAYREGVSFQYHNLVAHPFPSLMNNLLAFDLILCRNVTIYFGPEIIRQIIGRFYDCLVPGGWLLVGHAEPNLQWFGAFRTVNVAGAVLYQKGPDAAPAPAPWAVPPLPAMPPPETAVPPGPPWLPLPQAPAESAPAVRMAVEAPPLAAIRDHADRGRWHEAAALCQQALARDGLNAALHFYRALVLEQLGDHGAAEHALRRAIYLDRGFVLAHYYLGLHAQQRNHFAQAARAFRNALHLLTRINGDHVFADGDGLTAGELTRLTRMHLDILEGP